MFSAAAAALNGSGASLGALSNLGNSCTSKLVHSASSSSSFSGLVSANRRDNGFAAGASNETLTGVVFQPFEEVKKDEVMVPITLDQSLARQRFAPDCEAAINEQINVEYCVSYAYHSMYSYFDRDNVALKGLAKFFKAASQEEREHAEMLMEYQEKRGGKVKLQSLQAPPSEFDHVDKGDALYAMELALSLEKLTNEKLLKLHAVADENNDPQLADFVESEFLGEQVDAIKKISEYVSQLRRVGKGHGVWHFDQMLLQEIDAAAAAAAV
ncbi:ferritin-3, chloroplastic-like [Andrographis paniculata]|uniref:ferritin-3, chloroplastic-like n=1 Tax=Andrographis paniculata TaxID=175694 RepID=UPI0021E7BD31|nr:ferritin-3, chloroplastic-like [Andrographis paniculata]